MLHLARLFVSVAATICLTISCWAQETQGRSVEEIQKIIREYLYEQPEIILQAVERYREKQRAEKAAAARRAVTERREEIYEDPDSPVGGNPKGDVTLVEFFDYRCPHCKRFAPNLEKMKKEDPNIRIVYKEWPILGPASLLAARAALAAQKQDAYLSLHKAFMSSESQLTEPEIFKIAGAVGLDTGRLKKDMQDPAIQRSLEKNHRLAQALGFTGTPALLVGEEIVPGAIDFEKLKGLIAKARAR